MLGVKHPNHQRLWVDKAFNSQYSDWTTPTTPHPPLYINEITCFWYSCAWLSLCLFGSWRRGLTGIHAPLVTVAHGSPPCVRIRGHLRHKQSNGFAPFLLPSATAFFFSFSDALEGKPDCNDIDLGGTVSRRVTLHRGA